MGKCTSKSMWLLWTLLCFVTLWIPEITAKGPPRVIARVHRRQIVHVGETAKLACPVQGDPLPLLQWTKDGESINGMWDRHKMLSRALRIKDMVEEDSGVYVCKATNGFGSVEVDYRLYVLPDTNDTSATPPYDIEALEENYFPDGTAVAPQFVKPAQMRDQDLMRPAGNSIRLKCKATGKPKPQIIWFKDSEPIMGDPEEGEHVSESRWTLRLRDLRKDDSGKYTCKVFNRAGSINYTYTLEVIDRLSKPIILDPYPINSTVEYAQMASFQCQVHSEVQPTIQWLKRVDNPQDVHNKNTTITVKGQQFVVLKTGKVWSRSDGSYLNKLSIPRATERDSGMYICLGANSMGYSFRSAYLTVLPYPRRMEDIPASTIPLPLIIAVPAVVLVVVIIVVIFIISRRNARNKHAKTTVRQRAPPPMPTNDKQLEYAALHAYHHNNMQLSRERIIKNYSDFNSDVSQKMVPVPVPPPPPMQTFQNHGLQNHSLQNHNMQMNHHMHTYAPC